MNDGQVIDLVRNAIYIIFVVSAPILFLSIVVGLIVAILQTTTSIQEQSLVFIPKIVIVMISIVFFSYFIINRMMDYTFEVFEFIPYLSR